MNLIYYRGLNCHLACVVSIAANLGVDYQNAYSTLWSETDFIEDQKYHIYLSGRVIPNLEALGLMLEELDCESPDKSTESFFLIPEGELFVIGMDTFHIPWSLFYQHFHEPHFYFAQKRPQGFVSCFDPTYNQNNLTFKSEALAPYAIELSRVHRLSVKPVNFDIRREAGRVINNHPETGEILGNKILNCKSKNRREITLLIRRITAMINNRYLFQHYLHQLPVVVSNDRQFFDNDFLLRWEAVKNGLHKATIMKNNERTVDDVYRLFLDIIREEIDMARVIIDT